MNGDKLLFKKEKYVLPFLLNLQHKSLLLCFENYR